jgi:hypothetical protein
MLCNKFGGGTRFELLKEFFLLFQCGNRSYGFGGLGL